VAAKRFAFSKSRRLTRPAEFEKVKTNGHVQRGRLVMLSVASGGDDPFRAGFITSRAIGRAVARNRVRRALVPALESIHPAAAANVLRTAALLRDEAAVLDELVEAQLTRAPGSNGAGATIALERLAALAPALRRLVVQRLADEVAGRPVAGAARHADEVAALRRTGTAMLDLGSGVRAVVERGVLRAERGP